MNEFLMPNVIHYFPMHIADIEEFKRIAKVYDAQLKQVWVKLDADQPDRRGDSGGSSKEHKRTMGIKPPIYIQEV